MVFKTFQDDKLSALGMGAMRFPVIDGDVSRIDEAKTEEMIAYAMEHGINYYDTAWGYHNGNSEIVLGKILNKYPRHQFYLADKFPGFDLSNMGRVEEIFEEQCKRCNVEFFDFYLFHNVCEKNIDAYLDEKYGILAYLQKQKQIGRIRHLGFSAHGNYHIMKRFLEAYGECMEFCQIQLNYFDFIYQNAKAKLELLNQYHIPVWVMEPLRGGKLVSLPEEYSEKLKRLRPDEEIPAWAFRFLQTIPSVAVTLSGMSTLEQLKQNIQTFENERPLSNQEMDTLLKITDSMIQKKALPCTTCHYCTSHCPQELDIPSLIALYNEHCLTEGGVIAPMAFKTLPEEKRPSSCIGCRSCEAVCPQEIKISEAMADFTKKLTNLL